MLNIYSLADYTATITFDGINDSSLNGKDPITIGGPAEMGKDSGYVNSITLSRKYDVWDTEGDVTGGYIHNRNLSKVGTVSIEINQMSDSVAKLVTVLNICQSLNGSALGSGLNITISDSYGKPVGTATSCFIVKAPDRAFGEKVSNQNWQFTCGIVEFSEAN